VTDLNGASDLGFMQTQTTTKNGRRFSTAKSFLRPALRRKNLDILLNAYVTKVLIAGASGYDG
jgi:choline dehydrogenase-like flavoprotein